jgi:hypothetical protein
VVAGVAAHSALGCGGTVRESDGQGSGGQATAETSDAGAAAGGRFGSGGTAAGGDGNVLLPPPEPGEECSAPPVQGSCLAYFERFYFDTRAGRCLPFVYGGCEGNENNHEKLAACETACLNSTCRCDLRGCSANSGCPECPGPDQVGAPCEGDVVCGGAAGCRCDADPGGERRWVCWNDGR